MSTGLVIESHRGETWVVALLLLLVASIGAFVLAFRSVRELRAQRHLWRAFLEHCPDAIVIETLDGSVTGWNPQAERYFGFTASQAMGHRLVELIVPPERAPEDAQILSRGAAGVTVAAFDSCRQHQDGSLLDVSISAIPVFSADGRITGVAKTLRDIRDRKVAEEALRLSHSRIEEELSERRRRLSEVLRENAALLDALDKHSIVSTADVHGLITYANESFSRISGYTKQELVGQNHRIINSGVHPPEFWRGVWHTLRAGSAWRGEICNRSKSGALYWVDSIIAPLLDGEGRIIKYLSIRFDITPQKDAQFRIQEAQRFLESVERVSGVGGFMIDARSGALTWSQQSYAIYGLEPKCTPTQELVASMVAPDWRTTLQGAVERCVHTGESYDLELPLTTHTGHEIWIRQAGVAECEASGVTRIVGAVQDVTEQRSINRRLREAIDKAESASRAKGQFLANMSHEIRTPLNAIVGLGYLLGQTVLTQDQMALTERIQFAGQALLRIVNDVLDLAKIESDEVDLEDLPFALPPLLDELLEMLRPQAQQKGIELLTRISSDIPAAVRGDSTRLRQIMTNLLNNAIKFTESGFVELAVTVLEHQDTRVRVRFAVRDSGIGIAEDAIQKLFTPFTQADSSTTRRFGGTGLGLSIASRLARLMGGEIGVVSALGEGSEFWVELPLHIADEAGNSLSGEYRRTFQIVLAQCAEDCESLPRVARGLGWQVQSVGGGEELLQTLHTTDRDAWPDVLLIEAQMQDCSAADLIDRIGQELPNVAPPAIVVLLDERTSPAERKRLARSASATLARPINSSSLFDAITIAVKERHAECDRLLSVTNTGGSLAQWLPGVRILVADDSEINLDVARRILEVQGAQVTTCTDGSQVVTMLRTQPESFDVVLMDVQMPIMDGNTATMQIRTELKLTELPVIALTAGALMNERQRCIASGMTDFLSKPFEPQALIRVLRRHIERLRGNAVAITIADKSAQLSFDPGLSCIDPNVVQKMFGDDRSLFIASLHRVLREYAEFCVPITFNPEDLVARQLLQARMHKLKGSSGLIGAAAIHRLAGALENALRDAKPAPLIEAFLQKLTASLVALREEAATMVQEPAFSALQSAQTLTVSDRNLSELFDLLESQNLAALERFNALSGSFRGLIGDEQFAPISQAVDNLDFRLGAQLLRTALTDRSVA